MAWTRHAGAGWAGWAVAFYSVLSVLLLNNVVARSPRPRPGLKIYRSRLIPKMYDMVHCTDKRHSFRIRNVSTIMDRLGGDLLDVDFDLTEPASKLSSIKVIVQRCTGGVSLCEKMDTWSWATGLCDLMMAKHMSWSHIVEDAKPPIKCPLQAGSYTMYNVSLDLDLVDKAMPGANIEKHVWLSECHTFDENKDLYACFKWVTEARRVRVREDGFHLG